MKLSNFYPQIYVDMDGVLTDFDSRAREIIGHNPQNAKELWTAVKPYIKRGEFWATFKPMKDAFVLWNYVKKYNPTVLTAGGTIEVQQTAAEKKAWVKKYIGSNKVIVVQASKEKAKYANEKSILIDDSKRSIVPWQLAGGIGILHKSASATIRELKTMGL